jgi:hypothetical protein
VRKIKHGRVRHGAEPEEIETPRLLQDGLGALKTLYRIPSVIASDATVPNAAER